MWSCPDCGFQNDDTTEVCICGTHKGIEEQASVKEVASDNSKSENTDNRFESIISDAPAPSPLPSQGNYYNAQVAGAQTNNLALLLGGVAVLAVVVCVFLIINIAMNSSSNSADYDYGYDEYAGYDSDNGYEEMDDTATTDSDLDSSSGGGDEENSGATYFVNTFDDSGIYVRSGPGKEYSDILYIAKNDTSVMLLYLNENETGNDGYTWYKVQLPNGSTGYVREDVVRTY